VTLSESAGEWPQSPWEALEVHIYVCIYIYIFMCTYVYVCINVYTFKYVNIYVTVLLSYLTRNFGVQVRSKG
jgi:hypothetical protein